MKDQKKDIPFTFGIITYADGGIGPHLIPSIATIRELHIPSYEIILVGNKKVLSEHTSLKTDKRGRC